MPILFLKVLQSMVGLIFRSAYKDIRERGLIVGNNRKRILKDMFPTREERELKERIKKSGRYIVKHDGQPSREERHKGVSNAIALGLIRKEDEKKYRDVIDNS